MKKACVFLILFLPIILSSCSPSEKTESLSCLAIGFDKDTSGVFCADVVFTSYEKSDDNSSEKIYKYDFFSNSFEELMLSIENTFKDAFFVTLKDIIIGSGLSESDIYNIARFFMNHEKFNTCCGVIFSDSAADEYISSKNFSGSGSRTKTLPQLFRSISSCQ